jgi:hypothetical protein
MTERTFPQLCAVVMINDVVPRKKKHGVFPPPDFVHFLVKLEHMKAITRKDLRAYLDRYYAEREEHA